MEKYLSRFVNDEEGVVTDEVVKTYFEEIVEQSGVFEEQVLGAIENWTDLVEEADIQTQIGVITELRKQLRQSEAELDELHEKLSEREATEEEAEHLREEIEEKQQELERLRDQFTEEWSSVPASTWIASSPATGSSTISFKPTGGHENVIWSFDSDGQTKYECRECGNEIDKNLMGSGLVPLQCSRCGSEIRR